MPLKKATKKRNTTQKIKLTPKEQDKVIKKINKIVSDLLKIAKLPRKQKNKKIKTYLEVFCDRYNNTKKGEINISFNFPLEDREFDKKALNLLLKHINPKGVVQFKTFQQDFSNKKYVKARGAYSLKYKLSSLKK